MAFTPSTQGDMPGLTGGGPLWRFTERLLLVVGGIAFLLGLFTFLAGGDSSVGIGGRWTWQVDEITTGWKYALVVGGALLLLSALAMVLVGRHRPGAAIATQSELSKLLWHLGVFTAVNALIWLQDIDLGGGLEYAYWVTVPWGIGLAAHAVAYASSRRSAG